MGERDEPARLRDLLGKVGERLGMRDAAATGVVWARWREIVGAKVAEHAEPTSLRDGVLRVRTDSPSWATEVGYFAPEIVRRINEVAGGPLVDRVKVWTAPPRADGREELREEVVPDARASEVEDSGRPRSDSPEAALRAARKAWERARARARKRP